MISLDGWIAVDESAAKSLLVIYVLSTKGRLVIGECCLQLHGFVGKHAPPAWHLGCDDLRRFVVPGALIAFMRRSKSYPQPLSRSKTIFESCDATYFLQNLRFAGMIATAGSSYRLSRRGICPALNSRRTISH